MTASHEQRLTDVLDGVQGTGFPPEQGIGRLVWRARRRLGASFRTPSDEARNERAIYYEAVFQSISNAGALSFVSVFLVRLGAPGWLVGLYTSISALMMLLFTLPMGTYVQRRGHLVATMNRARFLFRTGIGSFALLPFLPAHIAPYMLVGVRGLIGIPDAALVVAEGTVIGKVTTPRRRPRMLSTRSAILGLFSAAVGLLAGQWLDRAAYPLNYQILFLTAFFSGLGSIWAISRIKLPETPISAEGRKQRLGLRSMWRLVRDAGPFRSFALAAFVFRLSMAMPSALYPIYRVRTLGSSDAWIGILYTVERLVNVGSYFVLGRLVTREGFRRWLWVGCLGMALYPLTTALATTPRALLFPSVLLGIVSPSMNLFLTDMLYRVSPETQRPTYVAANSFLSSMTSFAAPIIGTLLADAAGIAQSLIIIAGLRFLTGLGFWLLGVHRQEEVVEASVSA